MMFENSLPFIKEFVEQLDQAIQEFKPSHTLSKAQKYWLSFCLTGMLLTNTLCWEAFERASLGQYKQAALSWMFRHSKLPWQLLLQLSITLILKTHGIKEGVLSIDDTERKRAKNTKRIEKAHKLYDKKTGGYINGQELVVLYLITETVSIPVGFEFYQPDPVQTEWRKQDEILRKKGVKKTERPSQPPLNPAYPSKPELAMKCVESFKFYHPEVHIKAFLGDMLYNSLWLFKRVNEILGQTQVISQLKSTQTVYFRNRSLSVADYFARRPAMKQTFQRRGKTMSVMLLSARLYVKAYGRKCFVIALKYQGESDYRYLVASDVTWRTLDIVSAYSLRWLIEVFFEDWKLHEGWGQFALQPDAEGSDRGVILSWLLDYALLLHPEQSARLKDNLPACTVGSLKRHSQMEALIEMIRGVVDSDKPQQTLDAILTAVKTLFSLQDSTKHMNGKDLGRLEPTESLKNKAAACAA